MSHHRTHNDQHSGRAALLKERPARAMTTVIYPAEILDLVGTPLGTSSWQEITQHQINLFADATEDHQWIHVDADRAALGPFGSTIAHGYLTLALAPRFIAEVLTIKELSAVLNYGLNNVRFPAPVPVGSRLRGSITVEEACARGAAIEATLNLVVEIEDAPRPACVASVVVVYR